MLRRSTIVLLAWASASIGLAQDTPRPSTPPAAPRAGAPAPQPGAPAAQPIRLEDLPPPIRLAARAETTRRGWPSWPVVVIVPDARSYAEAIARWSIRGRFPVLIDDGSLLAREDIARFVRAYGPQRVVRWSVQAQAAAEGNPAPTPWPADRAARQAAIDDVVRRLWSQPVLQERETPRIETSEQLIARWRGIGLTPPGLVVADAMDRAWPAALALSAGRAQPIVWVESPQGVNGAMSMEALEALDAAIRRGAQATGLSFVSIGDELDAVTLCAHTPSRVQWTPTEVLSTTDMICRVESGPARQRSERWAWTGQIFGSEPQAAYRAMCALMLGIDTAWLFDGYPEGKPWSDYDASLAGRALREGGFTAVQVEDRPRQSERHWRLVCSFGIDASLVMVNTKGMADEFNLEPGQARPGDIPMLKRPAVTSIVHSFSAAAPDARRTVAGRWLERGSYAYFGSVFEPFLQAFVPTPQLAARLMANYPLGAATRPDAGPAWRLTLLGDPLIVIGPRATPVPADVAAGPFPLQGAIDLEQAVRDAVTARDFPAALHALTILGRDEDAARLAIALMRDDPRAFTAPAAAAAIMPLHRTRRPRELLDAYLQLPGPIAADPVLRDALWHAAYPLLPDGLDDRWLAALRTNLREDQVGRDAADIAQATARVFGRDVALGMLDDAKARSTTDFDRSDAQNASNRLLNRTGPIRP